jgi:hypothetical protein
MIKQFIKILFFDGYWTCNDVQQNRDHLFIFGDNNLHIGKGGQAIIRDEWNTEGIPTKKVPRNYEFAFYSDEDYDENCYKIFEAINIIKKRLLRERYKVIVLPEDGFGTGLAQLSKRAPLTFKYLNRKVKELLQDIGRNKLFQDHYKRLL